jgi:hypothetical protein
MLMTNFAKNAFENELSSNKVPWKCLWEQKIPTGEKLTAYSIEGIIVLHEALRNGGFELYLPTEKIKLGELIKEVMKAAV